MNPDMLTLSGFRVYIPGPTETLRDGSQLQGVELNEGAAALITEVLSQFSPHEKEVYLTRGISSRYFTIEDDRVPPLAIEGSDQRKQMIRVAIETTDIYAISIVPTEPQELQTWYYGKFLRSGIPCDSSFEESIETYSEDKSTPKTAPQGLRGFIRPFSHFHMLNSRSAVLPDLQLLPRAELGSMNASQGLGENYPPHVASAMATIYDLFQQDKTAEAVNVVYLDPVARQFKNVLWRSDHGGFVKF